MLIKVLLVSPLPPPSGGIATWTKILLEEVKRYPGVEVKHIDVAVRWKSNVNRSRFLQLMGGSLQGLRDIIRVVHSLIKFQPCVLHLTTSGGYASLKDALIMVLAKIFAVPGLIHYRTSRIGGYRYTGKWVLRTALFAMRVASVVVVLDQVTYAFLQKHIPGQKIKRIPNMINLNKIDEIIANHNGPPQPKPKTESVRLIFVGRVELEKGVLEQVEACSQLEKVHLHLLGPVEKSFQKKLQKIAHCREQGRWLYFDGQVGNVEARRQIHLSDILLLPSHHEAFPNVLLEAMALAKPVVVSDVGAMADMIDATGPNPCGVCVRPGDTQSLLAGLRDLLKRPEKWQDMGQNARKRVETLYSSCVVINQWEQQWREMKAVNDKL
jgi:glycosyltransferase involved in cell wall biosynthesis